MSSANPCGQCVHYDAQYRTINGVQTELAYGWCGKKSVYPAQTEPGQAFPPGCARAAEGELARPIIVYKDKVSVGCLDFLGGA